MMTLDQLTNMLPDAALLRERSEELNAGGLLGVELSKLVDFLYANADHLLAGGFVTYELSMYHKATVNKLLEALAERGYHAEYRRVSASSKLLDILSIYRKRGA